MGIMGRLPRTIADGLVYHAMNRRNNRADVFAGNGDHEAFLESLRVAKRPVSRGNREEPKTSRGDGSEVDPNEPTPAAEIPGFFSRQAPPQASGSQSRLRK